MKGVMVGLLIAGSAIPFIPSGVEGSGVEGASFAPQQAGSEPLAPAGEARVQRLGKELRCATCQGMSIADSPAAMARAQLDKVRSLVAVGKSDDEIRAYFIERYSEWVLLQPTAHGINWLVWLGPVALLVVGCAIIVRVILRRPAQGTTKEPALRPSAIKTEDELIARIRSELEQ
ncbi:MAG TPA: cytochrome c-type biogenesis protein [Myxococcales bacterium]